MRINLLICLALVSLFISACSSKDESTVTIKKESEEQVQNDKDLTKESLSENQGENDMVTKDTTAIITELNQVDKVTSENYKVIQKMYTKFMNKKENNENGLPKDTIEKVEKLNKEAIEFEKTLEKDPRETIISVFLENAMDLNAISAEGLVKNGIKFDGVKLTVNGKTFDATINKQVFTVPRKLVTEVPNEAIVKIYLQDKVIEERTVEIIKL